MVSLHLWILFHVWDHWHTQSMQYGFVEWIDVYYSLLPEHLLCMLLPWGEGVAWEGLSVWLFMRFLTKGRRLHFPSRVLRTKWHWGSLTSLGLAQLPGRASGGGGELHRINLMPNPWSAKQASIITSFLSGKYDLLFKDLIYGLVFRSTLRQEAVRPILPILFQALNNTSESFHLLFPNEISYSLCPTPTQLYIILNTKGHR